MKILRFLLAISLLANVWLAWKRFGPSHATDTAVAHAATPIRNRGPVFNGTETGSDNDDIRALTARLRAADMPESVLRAWVKAVVDERYKARKEAIAPPVKRANMWDPLPVLSKSAQLELADLNAEKDSLIYDLVGPDPALARSEIYGNLSEEARDKAKMTTDYNNAVIAGYRSNAGNMPTASETAEIKEAEAEGNGRLADFLNPQEMHSLDMALSATAGAVRREFAAVPMTQAEFDAMVAWRTDMGRFTKLSPGEPMLPAPQQNESQLINDRLKSIVGDDRYAQLVSPQFNRLSELAAREGLAPTAASDVYNLRRSLEMESNSIAQNVAVPAADRAIALQELAKRADIQLRNMLGDKGAASFSNESDAWLNMLKDGSAIVFKYDQAVRKPLAP